MLKGIPNILSPELLKTIAEMGHGDELVIGDCNFPAASMNARCVRADGHSAVALLDALLKLFPLDSFVECPVSFMAVTPGTFEGDPPIWDEYKEVIEKNEGGARIEFVERFAFYERAKKAFATVQTGEQALYACIILKKGVLLDV
ncbi:MAG: fucose isomerase [Oscillospiraceae bacterium]|nr:fucose isomerase [Oscillospiraceae bacterium]